MTRLAVASFGLLAAALAAMVALELAPPPREDAALPQAAPRQPPRPPAAAAAAANPEDHIDEWVRTVLARPLFDKDRRPSAAEESTASGPTTPDGLPRLTAVLVGPFGRSAIFAAGEAGKPAVLLEGGNLGAYRVETIEPGQVTLVGPDGPRVMRPAFDPNLVHQAPQPVMPGMPVMPGAPIQPGMPQSQPPQQPSKRSAALAPGLVFDTQGLPVFSQDEQSSPAAAP